MNVYPKEQAPVTVAVLRAANARADRWMRRTNEARAEVARLEAVIRGLEDDE